MHLLIGHDSIKPSISSHLWIIHHFPQFLALLHLSSTSYLTMDHQLDQANILGNSFGYTFHFLHLAKIATMHQLVLQWAIFLSSLVLDYNATGFGFWVPNRLSASAIQSRMDIDAFSVGIWLVYSIFTLASCLRSTMAMTSLESSSCHIDCILISLDPCHPSDPVHVPNAYGPCLAKPVVDMVFQVIQFCSWQDVSKTNRWSSWGHSVYRSNHPCPIWFYPSGFCHLTWAIIWAAIVTYIDVGSKSRFYAGGKTPFQAACWHIWSQCQSKGCWQWPLCWGMVLRSSGLLRSEIITLCSERTSSKRHCWRGNQRFYLDNLDTPLTCKATLAGNDYNYIVATCIESYQGWHEYLDPLYMVPLPPPNFQLPNATSCLVISTDGVVQYSY